MTNPGVPESGVARRRAELRPNNNLKVAWPPSISMHWPTINSAQPGDKIAHLLGCFRPAYRYELHPRGPFRAPGVSIKGIVTGGVGRPRADAVDADSVRRCLLRIGLLPELNGV